MERTIYTVSITRNREALETVPPFGGAMFLLIPLLTIEQVLYLHLVDWTEKHVIGDTITRTGEEREYDSPSKHYMRRFLFYGIE